MPLLPDRRLPPAPPAPRRRGVAGGLVLLVLLVHGALLGGWFRPAPPLGGAAAAPPMQLVRIQAMPAQPGPQVAPMPEAPSTTAAPPRVARAPMPDPVLRRPPAPMAGPPPGSLPAESLPAGTAPPPPPQGTGADRPPSPGPAADDEGEAEFAAGPGEPPPRYATRLPGSAVLAYRVQRGPLVGQARLQWQAEGDRYALRFEAQALGRPLIEQHSEGLLSGQGLVPERFTDRRRGRAPQTALFDREAGRIRFSGRPLELPAWPGALDRLGWVVQLAGIYAAAAEPPVEVRLFVVGARGGAGPWVFRLEGRETVDTPQGPVQALHLRREPEVGADQRVEAWLDPQRGHWPVRLRFTPVRGGPPFEWWLQAGP